MNGTQELTKGWQINCLFALYTSLNVLSQAIWRNLLLNQLQPIVSLCMWKLTQPTICLVHVPQVITAYFTSTTIKANILGSSHWGPKHARTLYKHWKMYFSCLDFQRRCIAIINGKEFPGSSHTGYFIPQPIRIEYFKHVTELIKSQPISVEENDGGKDCM